MEPVQDADVLELIRPAQLTDGLDAEAEDLRYRAGREVAIATNRAAPRDS